MEMQQAGSRRHGGPMEICPRRAVCLPRLGADPAGPYRCGFEICGTVAYCPRMRREGSDE